MIAGVRRTGRTTRFDSWADSTGSVAGMAHAFGIRSSVAVPMIVEGRLWGAVIPATTATERLPSDTETRIEQFTELVATAIAGAEARSALSRLVDEQAALRRVATLVAEASRPDQLLAKVAEEAALLLGPQVDSAILRYETDDTATVVAVWGEQPEGGIRVGERLPVDGSGVTALVRRKRGPVRVDHYPATEGAIAKRAQRHRLQSAVGCPILVQGRLWGAMVVGHYKPEPLHPDTERRVMEFTELVATAIANSEARAEVQRLADEQAGLRRVATLVAAGAAPTDVFEAVVDEVGGLLGAAQVGWPATRTTTKSPSSPSAVRTLRLFGPERVCRSTATA